MIEIANHEKPLDIALYAEVYSVTGSFFNLELQSKRVVARPS
jgi:hypothetical protein